MKQLFLVLSLLLAFALPSFAQSANFPAAHTKVLMEFTEKFGLPAVNDEAARAWTFQLGQQFAFDFPSEGWGTKSAGNGRPQSTDVLARYIGGNLVGYDVIVDQGIPGQRLIPSPGLMNINGQVFIPTPAMDYLGRSGGGPVTPIPVTSSPSAPISDSAALLAALHRIEQLLQAQVEAQRYSNDRLAALEETLATDPSPATLAGIKAVLDNLIAPGSWLDGFYIRLDELKRAVERKRFF